ncbi:MAG: nuclear transport factor 2 family protein [Rhizobiaceae bacterium]
MKKTLKNTIASTLLSVAVTGTALAETPKEIATQAVAAIFTDFDVDKAKALLAEDYIQHNPAVPTGSAAILGFIPALKESGITIKTHRTITDGNFVVTHNTYNNADLFGGKTLVAFDVFRIENGKVAEHWDNLTAVTEPNPSGHTQVDGPTEITDLKLTAENKEIVANFVREILVGGDMSRLGIYIEDANYTQHNSLIADGLSGLGEAIKAWADQGIFMKFTKVHKVIGEGNFVLTISEGTLGDAPKAFYDLFRVDAGKIVEHWDIIADILTESANENGKF